MYCKPIYLFLFLLLFSVKSFSQTEEKDSTNSTFTIPNLNDSISLSSKGYYIAEVKDIRPNKKNLGHIYIKKEKNILVTSDSLDLLIYNFLYPHISKDTSLQPIYITIERLKIFSSRTQGIDEAQIYARIKFEIKADTGYKMLHLYDRTINYRKKTNETFPADIVFKALTIAVHGIPNVTRNAPVKEKKETVSISSSPSSSPVVTDPGRTFYIPLVKEKLILNNPNFYISQVVDSRPIIENEGDVKVGFLDKKYVAKVDSGVAKYIEHMIDTTVQIGKKPLTLVIQKFAITEKLTPVGEKGLFTLQAKLVFDSAGQRYNLFQNYLELDSTEEDNITPAWPVIIRKGLETFVKEFESTEYTAKLDTDSVEKNGNVAEIKIVPFHYKNKYYWQNKELQTFKSFEQAYSTNPDPSIKSSFKKAISDIRTGRIFLITGTVFLSYSLLDFLLLEEQSLKNWYKSDAENSSDIMIMDKKVFIWSGIAAIGIGSIYQLLGKNNLHKAISKYNKYIAENLSLGIGPNMDGKGYNFQLKLLFGYAKP